MADDIVARLRAAARSGDLPLGVAFDCGAVADVIERLRAAGDALAATWPEGDRCNCNNADCRAVVAAVAAWEEARHG